jgi:pimeloyl-ACP methyl ester carboxylesterase
MIAIDETGHGPPLVLLHGVGASRAVWRLVTPALAEDRRVIAPDLPGFGESAPAANGFDLDSAAAALADPLAERAGGPFDLLGNSLGGRTSSAASCCPRRPGSPRSRGRCGPWPARSAIPRSR